MIARKLPAATLYGAGLSIGTLMLLLTLTGTLEWLARVIPKSVVRGIQFGLGLSLAKIAASNYVLAESWPGYLLAAASFAIVAVFMGNRRLPPALLVILLGVLYALVFRMDPAALGQGIGVSLPRINLIRWPDIMTGFLALALPQIPLSIANSVVATNQTLGDLFPDRKVGIRRIGLSYSLMNLVNAWLSGVPTCHGTGGLAGH